MKQTHSTKAEKAGDIERKWHLVDLKGKTLGRITSEITRILQGKNKVSYAPYLDSGDYVVAINAMYVTISGRKNVSKTYTSYSGYPGGLRTERYSDLIVKNPAKIIENAVSGMLPKNKFRDDRMRRLYVFKDGNHKYADKFVKVNK